MSTQLWAAVGTILGTLVFLVVPLVAYAWWVLDDWSRSSYGEAPLRGGASPSVEGTSSLSRC